MRLIEDLFLSSADEPRTSPAVPMGEANTAMIEVLVTSGSANLVTADGVMALLEGSNDGHYWVPVGLDTTMNSGFSMASLPNRKTVVKDGTTIVYVPYRQVRIRFVATSSNASPATAIVSADIQPWRA